MAVMALVEDVAAAIDHKDLTVSVFIDLSKAFDTIDHKLLLKKMQKYGFRGIAYDWLGSYLSNREQYVHINNIDSKPIQITFGVPQGSILGPKLFILYMNDVCEILDKANCILYADDTSIYCSGNDLQQLQSQIDKELTVLKKWFDRNKLSMNLTKTKYIVFGNRKIESQTSVKI